MAWHVRPSMARIALLIPDMRGGGAERVALTLIQEFIARGHQVDLVLLKARGELLPLLSGGVRIIDLQADRIRRAIIPLQRYLRAEQPSALLAMMWPMPVIAVISRILAGSKTRMVASDHGILSQHYQQQPAKLAALWLTIRIFYSMADRRVAASAAIADDLARVSGLSRARIDVIANPIETPPAQIPVSTEIEAQWHAGGPRILSVGSLKPEKDQKLLLSAFAELTRFRDASLLILGEGPLRKDLEARANQLGIADRVAMPGFRHDPWPYYASADIFVLASRSEGFGNVLVEAMAVGLPVVSTDCAGPREVLDEGRYGQLTAVGDVGALAAGMSDALAHRGDAEARRERARQFRPELAADRFLELLLADDVS